MTAYIIIGGAALLITLAISIIDAISSDQYYGDWK